MSQDSQRDPAEIVKKEYIARARKILWDSRESENEELTTLREINLDDDVHINFVGVEPDNLEQKLQIIYGRPVAESHEYDHVLVILFNGEHAELPAWTPCLKLPPVDDPDEDDYCGDGYDE